jgi:hypothetical protein
MCVGGYATEWVNSPGPSFPGLGGGGEGGISFFFMLASNKVEGGKFLPVKNINSAAK